MAALDFKEIPSPKAGAGRDEFELFAQELLVADGFLVVHGPDRGPDGGKDLIVEEERTGPGGMSKVRWLVSCKHNAHAGVSVGQNEETNIRDRLETHECKGFIAVYSTIPSSGLHATLSKLNPQFELLIYEPASIERKLLTTPKYRTLAARYFPKSFSAWIHTSQHVAPLASDPQHAVSSFFLRQPHTNISSGLEEARERKLLAFVVIFDPAHPSRSKLEYSLGCFMEYQTTKRLVDLHFVPILGPSTDTDLAKFVPEDDPLENSLWVVLDSDGNILRREGIYANPDEGLKRVRAVLKQCGEGQRSEGG